MISVTGKDPQVRADHQRAYQHGGDRSGKRNEVPERLQWHCKLPPEDPVAKRPGLRIGEGRQDQTKEVGDQNQYRERGKENQKIQYEIADIDSDHRPGIGSEPAELRRQVVAVLAKEAQLPRLARGAFGRLLLRRIPAVAPMPYKAGVLESVRMQPPCHLRNSTLPILRLRSGAQAAKYP